MFNYPDEIFEWENVMHKQIEKCSLGLCELSAFYECDRLT